MVLVYGGYRVMDGQTEVGVLAAFLLYLRRFFEPMQELSHVLQLAAVGDRGAGEAVRRARGDAVGRRAGRTRWRCRAAEGRLDLDGVRFGYRDAVVLPDLDLHVPAGQTVALVGATGAGKTTIARLVARFYDPLSGSVRLDGVDLRELSERDLRRGVVMVTQENFLFADTVAENIRFGRPGATDDRGRGRPRARSVRTSSSPRCPTATTPRSASAAAGCRPVSGSWWRSPARSWPNPAVLILDEATSSLDIPSERLVQRALRTILADRTALIIAHRLSTVEIADRVLVLEHGRIVEDGSPAELVGDGGDFAGLHQAWADSLV